MVKRLSEINRTALFAWSPGQQAPLIASGTAAGALDDSFSNASELELFKLDLKNFNSLSPAGKISSASRFNKLVWGNASSTNPYGIIAGGLENGDLTLWDPRKILDGKSDTEAQIFQNSTHTGQIRGLDFNKFQGNLLASAGSNNEVYIWDLTNPSTPYKPGPKSAKLDDITSVGWNGQVQHILATSSSNGHTVVWDLRNRKEVMTLSAPNSGMNTGRKSISSVAWHPDVATQLVTASEDDSNPVVTLWDLRHAHSPEKILAGHTKGVLGVSWCRQDSDLLLSCGKDCKTLIWNPNSGELMGELAQDTNWTFQTEWCPRNPDLLASASFEGKISVYSLQNSASEDAQPDTTEAAHDDPFSAAMNAAASANPSTAFALKQPPKWLRCPVGATFGFGGKLVTFNNKAGQAAIAATASLPPGQAPAPQTVHRHVNIASIVTNKETVQRAVELETALVSQSVEQLLEERVQQAHDADEKESWEVIKTLLAPDAREQLMNYLGFQKSEVIAAVAKATAGKSVLNAVTTEEAPAAEAPVAEESVAEASVAVEESNIPAATEEEIKATEETPAEVSEEKADETNAGRSNSVSGLFGEGGDDFLVQTETAQETNDDGGISAAGAAAAIGSHFAYEPLQLYAEGSSETDRLITRAVVIGDFESAVELCLSTDKLSDALLFAICGGGDLLLKTQQAYFKRQSKSTSYLRLLESIIDEDLSSVVASVSLDEWTSVVVLLCTFAKAEDFRPLCEALGERLEEGWSKSTLEGAKEFRRHATLCYLAAGNLDKVARIWITEQEEEVQSSDKEDIYAASLQRLIEKVTIFRKVIAYEDAALFETESKMHYEYPLSPLYDKYCEYAELLAAQGKLTTALTYLSLTPTVYRKATFDNLSIIRDRVFRACPTSVASQFVEPAASYESKAINSKAAAFAAETQAAQAANTYAQPQAQQQFPSYTAAPTQSAYAPVRSPVVNNSYAPIANTYAPAQTTNHYAPTAATTTNTYAPTANANTNNYGQTANANYSATQPRANYAPTASVATNQYAPVTATGTPTNTYQPSTPAAGTGYNNNVGATPSYGYNQPSNGGYNNFAHAGGNAYGNDNHYNNNNNAYENTRPSIPPPPPVTGIAPSPRSQEFSAPPKKPEGAWNDPPMAVAAAKKMKSPKVANSPSKRVTSPFPNQPSATSFVAPPQHQQQQQYQQQQQQSNLPPPPQGGIAPPPMNRGPPQGFPPPPRAGMPHQGPPPHQQGMMQPPPHMRQQQPGQQQPPPPMGLAGPPRQNNPLPPPPMGATPPPPLSKQGPPRNPPPQGQFYQPQRMQ